jgi:hypothetical protein
MHKKRAVRKTFLYLRGLAELGPDVYYASSIHALKQTELRKRRDKFAYPSRFYLYLELLIILAEI